MRDRCYSSIRSRLHTGFMSTQYPQQNQPLPPQDYAPQYYVPLPRAPFSQLAIGGFVASLIGLGLLGLPLSIAGLVATQRKGLRGAGLAVVGILVGCVWAFFNIAFLSAMFTTGG